MRFETSSVNPYRSIGMDEFLEAKYVCMGLGYERDGDD